LADGQRGFTQMTLAYDLWQHLLARVLLRHPCVALALADALGAASPRWL
jgi:hypothetical protein